MRDAENREAMCKVQCGEKACDDMEDRQDWHISLAKIFDTYDTSNFNCYVEGKRRHKNENMAPNESLSALWCDACVRLVMRMMMTTKTVQSVL
jgi:hypothetical protein